MVIPCMGRKAGFLLSCGTGDAGRGMCTTREEAEPGVMGESVT